MEEKQKQTPLRFGDSSVALKVTQLMFPNLTSFKIKFNRQRIQITSFFEKKKYTFCSELYFVKGEAERLFRNYSMVMLLSWQNWANRPCLKLIEVIFHIDVPYPKKK